MVSEKATLHLLTKEFLAKVNNASV